MSIDTLAARSESNIMGSDVPLWKPVLFAALAGGMAWGIRGQYGHETGAMIAGLLVSLTLVYLLFPRASLPSAARAVAWGTVAMGFGGSMTYGQTLGLTQNAEVLGNWEALRWGLLGTAIKGGAWIGFAGVFLGIGLGGKRYRPLEMALLMLGLVAAYYVGIALLNSPLDRAEKIVPAIYFSASWYWEPEAEALKPRPECWGGLWLALAVMLTYTGWRRKDGLAWRLGLWGVLGGALGFPLGQCLQAYHAWNLESFREGLWKTLDPNMNWWNMMETTFGAIMGGTLGLGLWLNRKRIQPVDDAETRPMLLPIELLLLAVHISLLFAVEFREIGWVDALYDPGVILGVIPMVVIAGGRWSPYLMLLPVTLMPIAGKTIKELVYSVEAINAPVGWIIYAIVPLLIATAVAIHYGFQSTAERCGREFARRSLLLCAWMYFCLNFAYFRFPWPWSEWTSRTPNGIIFTICVLGLTWLAIVGNRDAGRMRLPGEG